VATAGNEEMRRNEGECMAASRDWDDEREKQRDFDSITMDERPVVGGLDRVVSRVQRLL
jgi:hypothetical protein